MLFGKLFTTFTLAAMAISHVACAPTAELERAALQKRNTASDVMGQCYSDVQNQCNDIDHWMSQQNYQVDDNNCGELETKILAICDRIAQLCIDIKVEIDLGVSVDDINNCGNIFVSLVKLLCTLLLQIFKSCTGGATATLAACVFKLKGEVETCYSLVRGCVESFLGGLLGLILGLLSFLLGDLDACFSSFVTACGSY